MLVRRSTTCDMKAIFLFAGFGNFQTHVAGVFPRVCNQPMLRYRVHQLRPIQARSNLVVADGARAVGGRGGGGGGGGGPLVEEEWEEAERISYLLTTFPAGKYW